MKKETVLITGANSFIAKHLIPLLADRYILKFLTRAPQHAQEYGWDVSKRHLDEGALDEVSYIIHLAGAKLNDGSPMTAARQTIIRDSRIAAADMLRERLIQRGQKIKSFISASAIGYYGFTDRSIEIDEDGDRGIGFSADLSADWEKAADAFKEHGVAAHVAKIRVSLVLGNDGGIFPMYTKMVLDNPALADKPNLGSYPWNHVADMAGIFAHAVTHDLDGVYNSVAPQPTTMQGVFQAIANARGLGSYTVAPVQGQYLVSHRIQEAGFSFQFPTIESAVSDLIK